MEWRLFISQEIGQELVSLNQEIGSMKAAKELESLGLCEVRELKSDFQVSGLVLLLKVVFFNVQNRYIWEGT